MKRYSLLAGILFLGLPTMAFAQDNATSPYGTGKDSIECLRNITFMKTYARSNNFQDAYTFWEKAYKGCPSSTKDIYILGAKILGWKIENEKDEAQKKSLLDELMGMYDSRIQYFGDDPKTGKDYILGSKANDYIRFMGAKADFSMVYDWLKDIVAEKKESADALALSLYTYSSMMKMAKDDSHKEKYISDYMTISGYFDKNIQAANESGNSDRAGILQNYKTGIDTQFAASGAASCDMLEKIYAGKVDENKGDKAYLETVVGLLQKLKCQENPVYFKAAEYLYALSPSANAAIGIARQAMSKKQYDRATKFYEEAIKLSTDSQEKSEAYYNMAVMAYQQRQYAKARGYCNQAMQERSGFGAPMLLIAQMYAATAPSIYPDDPVLSRIVYCLVVDKCQQAKAMDSSIADEANKLIGTYSRHYPAKEDVFMHPKLTEGASFTIGGWIGETTTVRCSN